MEPATSPHGPIRVLIADDHTLFAEALEAILSADPRIEVVGRAADGLQAVALAEQLAPAVVLLDISMPVMDGFEAAKRLQLLAPEVAVLILTGSNSPVDVDRARQAGVAGYVTKDRIAAQLIDAILEVADR
jgi:DNA-binding NarL/FixJ family response regulator